MPRYEEFQPENIKKALNKIRIDRLKNMVKTLQPYLQGQNEINFSSPPSSRKKIDTLNWFENILTDKKSVKFLYQKMDKLEKCALREVVFHYQGLLDSAQIMAKYGVYPVLQDTKEGFFSISSTSTSKVYYPLLSIFMAKQYLISRDVQKICRTFLTRPPEVKAKHQDFLPEKIELPSGNTEELVCHFTEQAAITDIQTMLGLASQKKIGISPKTGRVSKAGAKKIRDSLSQKDFYPEGLASKSRYDPKIGEAGIRPFAWTVILQAGGLAKEESGKLVLTSKGKSALKKEPQDILKQLWYSWLENNILHEMNRIEVIKGQRSKKKPLHAAKHCRYNLEQGLVDLQTGNWIFLQDFFKLLFAKGDVQEVDRNPWALYILDPEHGSFGYDHINWEHLTGRFARAFLLEYAATLGLIDVALVKPWGAVEDTIELWGADALSCLSRYDGLIALRLTSLGAWILEKTKEYKPIEGPKFLETTPEKTVHILDKKSAFKFKNYLKSFCRKKDETTYSLDFELALKSMEQGISALEMLEFLRKNSLNELPQSTVSFFQDLEKRSSMFQLAGEAKIIACKDKSLLYKLLTDLDLRSLCLPISDNELVLRKENEAKFLNRLRKLGYILPAGK